MVGRQASDPSFTAAECSHASPLTDETFAPSNLENSIVDEIQGTVKVQRNGVTLANLKRQVPYIDVVHPSGPEAKMQPAFMHLISSNMDFKSRKFEDSQEPSYVNMKVSCMTRERKRERQTMKNELMPLKS